MYNWGETHLIFKSDEEHIPVGGGVTDHSQTAYCGAMGGGGGGGF